MPSSSARGIVRERDLRRLLEAEGWWVGRCAGSLGDADLVALRGRNALIAAAQNEPYKRGRLADKVRLIEVKTTAAGPFHSFGPKQRAELLEAARIAGAEAWLVHWPPRQKEPKWYRGPNDWPKERGA